MHKRTFIFSTCVPRMSDCTCWIWSYFFFLSNFFVPLVCYSLVLWWLPNFACASAAVMHNAYYIGGNALFHFSTVANILSKFNSQKIAGYFLLVGCCLSVASFFFSLCACCRRTSRYAFASKKARGSRKMYKQTSQTENNSDRRTTDGFAVLCCCAGVAWAKEREIEKKNIKKCTQCEFILGWIAI